MVRLMKITLVHDALCNIGGAEKVFQFYVKNLMKQIFIHLSIIQMKH